MYERHLEGVHRETLTSFRLLFPSTPGPGGEWVIHFHAMPAVSGPLQRGPMNDTHVFFTQADRDEGWRSLERNTNIVWVDLPVINEPIGAEE